MASLPAKLAAASESRQRQLAKQIKSQDLAVEKSIDAALGLKGKKGLLAKFRKTVGIDGSFTDKDEHSVNITYAPKTKATYEQHFTNRAEAISVQSSDSHVAVCKALEATTGLEMTYRYCARFELPSGTRTDTLSYYNRAFDIGGEVPELILSERSAREFANDMDSSMTTMQASRLEELAVCLGLSQPAQEPVQPVAPEIPATSDAGVDAGVPDAATDAGVSPDAGVDAVPAQE